MYKKARRYILIFMIFSSIWALWGFYKANQPYLDNTRNIDKSHPLTGQIAGLAMGVKENQKVLINYTNSEGKYRGSIFPAAVNDYMNKTVKLYEVRSILFPDEVTVVRGILIPDRISTNLLRANIWMYFLLHAIEIDERRRRRRR